ncbi:hypothetical protein CHUAL_005975 [Chamberlinius hualienensis]
MGGGIHWQKMFLLLNCLFYYYAVLFVEAVEFSFEDKYSGFFLKNGQDSVVQPESGTVVRRDQFYVLQPSRSTMIRVGYGPFTAKQTVPFPSSLPLTSFNQSLDLYSHWPTTTDVTAYLVSKEIVRDRPVLRVIFHFTQNGRESTTGSSAQNYQNLCVLLIAINHEGQRKMAACNPLSQNSTCLAELIIPHTWWPSFKMASNSNTNSNSKATTKVQKAVVQVEYVVAVDVKKAECQENFVRRNAPTQLPTTSLSSVSLSPNPVHYSEVMENGSLQIFIPRIPLFPKSKMFVPVFIKQNYSSPVNIFIMSAKVKSGIRILEAEASAKSGWSIEVNFSNQKRTQATVTAFLTGNKDSVFTNSSEFEEVFSWLLEVNDDADQTSARISWIISYKQEAGRAIIRNGPNDGIRLATNFEVLKDDIQSVLLVSKTWELINTAILNGKQVSLPVKVFMVSHGGKIADVTLQSSCVSGDESILKVSSSCTSVYLDGSEVRGSHNASVVIKYGSFSGMAEFTVWLPELPLEVYVEDPRLSQIKNWKAPKQIARKLIPRTRDEKKFAFSPSSERRVICRLRYQQTSVHVFSKFIAVDDNSGRQSYLLNRKTLFRITDLVEDFLRVADPRIANIKGRFVQGQSVGRTEVQILSPITGRVIGASELRVGKDKKSIIGLSVNVVTGLQLSIKSNYDTANTFVTETAISRQLTAQYQEGLLDINVLYSDGMESPLADIIEDDFSLVLHAMDQSVVALAPMASSHHPRVIVLGEGNATIHVSLETSNSCRRKDIGPLAVSSVNINVKLKKINNINNKVGLQNDDVRSKKLSSGHQYQLDRGLSSFEGYGNGPSVSARQNPVLLNDMSPLEIGMYALLGIFCLAIVVFVASCAIYAVQFHQKQTDNGGKNDPVSSAHDWVWLGRTSTDKKTVSTNSSNVSKGVSTHFDRQRPKNLLLPYCRRLPSTSSAANRSSNGSNMSNNSINSNLICVTNENANPFMTYDTARAPNREKKVQIVVNPMAEQPQDEQEMMKTFGNHNNNNINFEPPPPVPPHGRPLPTQRASSCLSSNTFTKETSIKTGYEDSTMDYDVLVEYFDNLKESNA